MLLQEAGQPGDPCWRPQPALGHAGPDTMSNGNAHDGSLANGHGQNGHAPPTFTFGVPSAEFLDFSGPGGPAVAAGAYSDANTSIMACSAVCILSIA